MSDIYDQDNQTSVDGSLLINILKSIPQVFLALVFISHGLQALSISPRFVDLVMVVGFIPLTLAKFTVFIVGIVDMTIAGLVLFIDKVIDRFNSTIGALVLVYAALWPAVPSVLSYLVESRFEVEFIPTIIFATFIYFLKVRAPKIQ